MESISKSRLQELEGLRMYMRVSTLGKIQLLIQNQSYLRIRFHVNSTLCFRQSSLSQRWVMSAQSRNSRAANIMNSHKEIEEQRRGLPLDSIREIKFLQQLIHPNIIQVVDFFFLAKTVEQKSEHHHSNHSTHKEEKTYNLMMVMQLCIPIEKLAQRQIFQQFQEEDFKAMFKQILNGVCFLHSNYIIHRVINLNETKDQLINFCIKDIKVANLLIDKNKKIVLTDFGLSREYGSAERRLTGDTFTSNYRPPEIVLGSMEYGPKSDIWALGVVFAEMLMRFELLFPTSNHDDDTNLLRNIFALRGTPTAETWQDFDKLPRKIQFDACKPKQLKNIDKLRRYSTELLNILESMLSLNPNNRPTAQQLLDMTYFKDSPEETKRYIDCVSDLQRQ